jgi:hypothetical protein
MRTTTIRKSILDILARCKPHALPEKTLLTELNVMSRPPVGAAEFDEHITWLGTRKFIAAMEGELGDDEARWLITEAGEAQLLR